MLFILRAQSFSSSAEFPYPSCFNLYSNQDNQLSQSQDFDHELEVLKLHRANSHSNALLNPAFL